MIQTGAAFERFCQLTKVDEERREVHGILAMEMADHAGEIMDYERSKPHFLAWSESQKAASGGKSAGNLRAMHGKTVAGLFTSVTADDVMKGFPVIAKVIDDQEWEKCKTGAYTGFSIGGNYGAVWPDEKVEKLMRYEALPVEGSLVDKPCIPGSTFSLVRADGTEELRKFVEPVVEKDAAAAVAVADEALTALKALVAELVLLPGEPDTWALERVIEAIRGAISGKITGEIAMETPVELAQSAPADELKKLRDGVEELRKALAEQVTARNALDAQLVAEKATGVAAKSANDAMAKSVEDMRKRLDTIEQTPVRPGRPATKDLGTGGNSAKVDALDALIKKAEEIDPTVGRALRLEAAMLANRG